LRQDTAGFIYGKDAYKDPEINRSNPTPEAFRNVNSQRLYGLWSRSLGSFDLDIRPYIRHSDMQFMHFELPGQPVEDNGQVSAGVVSAATFEGDKLQTITGLDVEWADAYLEQTQPGPASGPPRQQQTRPQGKHYDYEVKAFTIAPFIQTSYQFNERFSLGAGLRLEYTHYDYNNRMLAGNTREDGSVCGFGGCLYTRPADRRDRFTNLVPNLSAGFQLTTETRIYTNLARGFRAPQMLELYRLQNGQQVSDLDSERVDSLELGLRRSNDTWSAELSVYTMRKKDSVFRDAEGYNVSGARSRHRGVEIDIDWQIVSAWYLSADASYAQHKYDFDYTPARGESFVRGNDIDTAPRWLASAELRFAPAARWWTSVQWTYLGKYYLDPSNRRTYSGHQLLDLRVGAELGAGFDVVFRLNNLADKLIAERADFGSGDYRYLPGRGRELFVEVRYFPLW
jgi:outer membrane receptor protein involved in Fe transport